MRGRPKGAVLTSTNDRERGCLLGLAIGDALGAPIEFSSPGTFEPVTDYRAGGPHGLNAGEWTDDTAMALALAESIAEAGWDLDDQARRYVRWWREGDYSVNGVCFDIGGTTARALARFERFGDAAASGIPDESASGNGSIMRLAPVAIRYAGLYPGDLAVLGRCAEESSLPTHASPQCRSACRYLALLLSGLIQGEGRETVLAPQWPALVELRRIEPLHPAVAKVADGSFRGKEPAEIRGSGYVVESLEAALWAFQQSRDFAEAVLAAVNLGDDADTTGAVCGQLAGACWGGRGIPDGWLANLAQIDMIEARLNGLLKPGAADGHDPPRAAR